MTATLCQQITLGKRRLSQLAGGFEFAECEHDPALVLPTHAHHRAHLCYVIEGVIQEGVGAREFEVAPGSLIVKGAAVEHWNRFGGQSCLTVAIEIDPERVERLREAAPRFDEMRILASRPMQRIVKQLVVEMRLREHACPLVLEGLALQLIGTIANPSRDTSRHGIPAWLRRAHDLLRDPQALEGGLAGIAALVGVHPVHLARSFRENYGCTVGEYVRGHRIDAAKRLLAESDLSISQVAAEVGFSDQPHLTRLFRRVLGVTPAVYRRTHRPAG